MTDAPNDTAEAPKRQLTSIIHVTKYGRVTMTFPAGFPGDELLPLLEEMVGWEKAPKRPLNFEGRVFTRAVPQPPQEPTPEAVERAAIAGVEESAFGWPLNEARACYTWATMTRSDKEEVIEFTRAALTAYLTAPA